MANQTGKYLNDYYVIGGANVRDKFDNPSVTYWITWLDTGERTCGFTSAVHAARAADRIVESQLVREKTIC
jgi:hypothetical protein